MVLKNKKQDGKVLLEQKAYEFEMLRQQLSGIDKELQELNVRIGEFERVKQSLEGIKSSKKDEDLLVPLGEGLFIKARITDTDNVLLGVGSSVVVGKSLPKALDYVKERIDEADNLINRLNQNAQYFTSRMRQLEPELKALTEQSRK